MLSLGSRLCFLWPRNLYSLLDLIRFDPTFASTNFLFLFILQRISYSSYEQCTNVCDKLVFIPLDDPGKTLNAAASAIMTSTTAANKNHPDQFSIRSFKEDEVFWGRWLAIIAEGKKLGHQYLQGIRQCS
jgi:hypothetical protein